VGVSEARGPVRVRTVSGDAKVSMAAGASQRIEFASTSGDALLGGNCGAGCRIEAHTCSGDVALALDASSSFDLSFVSHDGDLADGLHLVSLTSGHEGERSLRRRYGRGEGLIEVETYSGDLQLKRR
jgi:hypothetical protein